MNDNPGQGVPEAIRETDGWQSVLDDMTSTAEAYRDDGWQTLELHPGDSVLVDSDRRTGLDVLLSGPEYEQLESLASSHTFSTSEVFAAESAGLYYLLIVERDPDAETAVFVPAYYELARSREALDTIVDDGALRVFCRRLNNDYVAFDHDDIAPFVPTGLLER
ncbi:hypothetical protein C479_14368 [Halovivax asiaticus JCM 14624]|uniref:Uncharacterized protein n=1 Tax=Halovivax asiaticus JCM 14624 TaxID=1227490 RepID=M0BCB1_9EURY|nr:hypothetical protein [Halovivax asiaticus]ELZ08531.1 hypothetical protein C479_14368 [Halovivax asiaticus JCM 14624]